MQKTAVIFFISCLFILACKKTNTPIPAGISTHYDQSNQDTSSSSNGGAFSFAKLTASPNVISKGSVSKVIAKASGSNLTYKWTTSHGELFGNGSSIYYSDSCVGTYTITCTVSDGTNSASITISITVID